MTSVQDLISAAKESIDCLSAEESAKKAREAGVLLVDLREPAEHDEAAVAVAVHIPRGVLEFKIGDACADKSQEILLHCGGGGRASLAAQSLKSMGYENVSIVSAPFTDFAAAFAAG